MSWQPVIGLEIHVQLATRSKIFSGAPTAYGAPPNTQACAVDVALPGTLPVLNAEAVRLAALFGLAIGGTVATRSVFARKNYFYPDLPKGYQISQYELPIVSGGAIDIEVDGRQRRIRITRAHLEEDAGKSLHEDFHGLTGIDLNRAGTPLIEVVSEPDLRSAAEAVAYARAIHTLVRWIGVSDANMEEGSLRFDANVSLRRDEQAPFGTRTEIKNLNSFRFLERAIAFEIERQAELLDAGREVVQETRLYDAARDETRAMRSKEEAHDYRYFPDPDLLPLVLDESWIEARRRELPELPDARRRRLMDSLGLGAADAAQLTTSRALADYYEQCVAELGDAHARLAASWVLTELQGALNRDGIDVSASPLPPTRLAALLRRVVDDTISGRAAKQVFDILWREPAEPDEVIRREGLEQVSDSGELEALVEEVIAASPEQVAQYRAGRQKVLGYFVGQVMKRTGGKANPKLVNELLRARLGTADG